MSIITSALVVCIGILAFLFLYLLLRAASGNACQIKCVDVTTDTEFEYYRLSHKNAWYLKREGKVERIDSPRDPLRSILSAIYHFGGDETLEDINNRLKCLGISIRLKYVDVDGIHYP